jgi:pimeloyl-ACP methyl ester carboxylesterase
VARYRPVAEPARVPQQPYLRHSTEDAFGRRVVFYVSEEPADAPPLPLVGYVQGSGCSSLFVAAGGRPRGTGGHNTLRDVVAGRARLVIVEKPGVEYLDAPRDAGGAGEARAAFREEHTLERWCEAVHAALQAARVLPCVRAGRVLVVGHSEGGIVASKLAADHGWITHVAVLAGGGPTQLFDLVTLARRGAFFAHVAAEPELRVQHVLDEWQRIRADPESATQLFFGHPYRRWSSFLATSTLDQLLAGKARVYAAQGGRDAAVAPESFELLRAGLLARGRDATFDLVADADHSFARPGGDGWREVLERVVAWFLAVAGGGGK